MSSLGKSQWEANKGTIQFVPVEGKDVDILETEFWLSSCLVQFLDLNKFSNSELSEVAQVDSRNFWVIVACGSSSN